MDYNILLDTDSYKPSHWLQYPPSVRGMFSYVESRGGLHDAINVFGLRYIIQEYLSKRMTIEHVDEAEYEYRLQGIPFNREGVLDTIKRYDGFVPVKIRSVPEGTVLPVHNAFMTIECLDKNFWFGEWLEDILLRVWYPTTVATESLMTKKVMKPFVERTCDDISALDYMLHDFGARGVSSYESAQIGGASHLISFKGSDTIVANRLLRKHYDAKGTISVSIPASEHSTITSWGKDMEAEAYRNMLKIFADKSSPYKVPMFACVSDSYNIYNAVSEIWGNELKEIIQASDTIVVIRPDSGDPASMVLDILNRLEAKFGTTLNTKGFKVLNNVRVIQGDGVDRNIIETILTLMEKSGFSASNVAFGMGGALLQKVNRDTQKFALKCSSVLKDDTWFDVYKDPITDPGKTSKKGRLDLVRENGIYKTINIGQQLSAKNSILESVYDCGKVFYSDNDNYASIKNRVNAWLATQ